MPKHENIAFQKKIYYQFKKGTFSVECATCMGHGTPGGAKRFLRGAQNF